LWPHGGFRESRGLFGPLGPELSPRVLVGSSRNRVFCPTSTTTTVTVITRLDLISDGSSPSSAGVGEWSVCVYKNMPDSQGSWIRPYQPQSTGSHPNTEVNVVWACSVLGWGTTREQCGVESTSLFARSVRCSLKPAGSVLFYAAQAGSHPSPPVSQHQHTTTTTTTTTTKVAVSDHSFVRFL
jgi:hypothetical protein